MNTRAWGEEYRATTICVDAYEEKVLDGRFYNNYMPSGEEFRSTIQFLLKMEQTLDTMEFPRAFSVTRSFAQTPGLPSEKTGNECRTGALATFSVRILFRQNASWQGSIAWLEGRQEQSFRSVLELLLLMDTALNQAAARNA